MRALHNDPWHNLAHALRSPIFPSLPIVDAHVVDLSIIDRVASSHASSHSSPPIYRNARVSRGNVLSARLDEGDEGDGKVRNEHSASPGEKSTRDRLPIFTVATHGIHALCKYTYRYRKVTVYQNTKHSGFENKDPYV